MSEPKGIVAPESDTETDPETDPQSDLDNDPEIAELLTFEPVPRRFKRGDDGWTAPLQRAFIRHLARHGSPGKACEALDKHRSGIDKVYKAKGAESFRAAWAKAVEIAEERAAKRIEAEAAALAGLKAPFRDNRRKPVVEVLPLPGQVLNERDEWEDEDSFLRRAEDARDSMTNKLLHARRLYLAEISDCPGKRAAFEILTELPIDWDRARRLKPQRDEPWRKPNMRRPDMLLTAENGWLGDMAHGRDKLAEARKAMDEYRAEMGMAPVDWSESGGTQVKDESRPDGWAIVNPKGPGVRRL
jgi:hypothetical protein